MVRRRIAEASLVVAVLAAITSIATTWTTSGQRDRNGLATLESLDRLDVLETPWDTVLVVVSASIPLFLALATVGVAVGRPVLAAAGAGGAGLVLVCWGIVVLRSPLSAAPGPHLALLAAFALMVTAGATARAQRRKM